VLKFCARARKITFAMYFYYFTLYFSPYVPAAWQSIWHGALGILAGISVCKDLL
jgi:hypothetical protein